MMNGQSNFLVQRLEADPIKKTAMTNAWKPTMGEISREGCNPNKNRDGARLGQDVKISRSQLCIKIETLSSTFEHHFGTDAFGRISRQKVGKIEDNPDSPQLLALKSRKIK